MDLTVNTNKSELVVMGNMVGVTELASVLGFKVGSLRVDC